MKTLSALVAVVCMLAMQAEAQPLLSPRAIALGAYDATVKDIRGFTANAAGLAFMKDWDFLSSTYLPTGTGASRFVFGSFSLGKRLPWDNAVALQYSPGALQEFTIPSAEKINGQNIAAERTISYQEPLAIGFAHQFSPSFAAGIGVRLQTTSVTDPQFQLQLTDSTIIPIPTTWQVRSWIVDPAVVWKPLPLITLSAIGRGLVSTKGKSLPAEFASFTLPAKAALDMGCAIDVSSRLRIMADASTAQHGACGLEWNPGLNLSLRGGVYFDRSTPRFVDAMGAGAGWNYEFIDFDLAYLRFTDQTNRKGSAPVSALDASDLRDISMNPFAPNRIALSVKAFFGAMREPLIRIEGVTMGEGVFPAAFETFAYRPLGKVRVQSIASKPVDVKASFFVDRFMDQPTETPPVRLEPGEVVDLPLTAVFNERIRSVQKVMVRDGDVRVAAMAAEEYDDRVQTRVVIHGRNDWDGDVMSLRYFVTPDDPDVIRYSRDILLANRDSVLSTPRDLEPFEKAKLLFNAFAGKLIYVNDPRLTADYVQYPSETLSLRGGDCDDMTVCFVSLLASIGISTAFVDVVPPDRPGEAHIYLLFDSGLDPRFGKALSDNPKRYVVRKNSAGKETLWVPVETTVITRGFDAAWMRGAEEHLQHSEIDLGLIKGWVRIVDVN